MSDYLRRQPGDPRVRHDHPVRFNLGGPAGGNLTAVDQRLIRQLVAQAQAQAQALGLGLDLVGDGDLLLQLMTGRPRSNLTATELHQLPA